MGGIVNLSKPVLDPPTRPKTNVHNHSKRSARQSHNKPRQHKKTILRQIFYAAHHNFLDSYPNNCLKLIQVQAIHQGANSLAHKSYSDWIVNPSDHNIKNTHSSIPPIPIELRGEPQPPAPTLLTQMNAEEFYNHFFYYRGVKKAQEGDYSGAIETWTQEIRRHPDFAPAYFDRANIRRKLKDLYGALDDYTEVIEICPDCADAYFKRGNTKRDIGNHQSAIEDYNEVIRLNPTFAEAYNNRGNARRDIGDHTGAIQDYNKAVTLNPNYSKAYYNRALSRRCLGNSLGAIEDYNHAIRIKPDYAKAYYNRGFTYSDLGAKQKALTDLQQAAELFLKHRHMTAYRKIIQDMKQLEL